MRALRRPTGSGRRGGGRLHPVAIAAIVIVAVIAITYYAFHRSLPFSHRFTLYALVNNSVNVRSGSPVRIAGIDVGEVRGTSPAGNATRIEFTMSNQGLPIHKDATIRIRDRLFLEGGYYLEVDPGSPSAPSLRDGDTIPLSQTSSPVQFYQVLSTFDIATRTSLVNLVNTVNEGFSPAPAQPMSSSGAGGLKTAIPQFTPVLKDVAWITRSLRGTRPGDVQTLLSSASQVTGTLAETSPQLADLVSGLNVTSSALASSDGALAQSVAGIDQTLQAAPPALNAVDHALPPLVDLAHALDPSLRVAPPLVDSLIGTVNQLTAALAEPQRDQLLSSLKATFEEFPSLLTQLGSAFPITKQVTDCLQSHVIPMLEQQVPDGALSTGRPVWQDFVHFLPNLAGATGDFDANGHYTRSLAGAGNNTVTGGLLGNLPGGGKLIGSSPPGNKSLQGARPQWVGDLTPSDFRPDVPCTTQKLPSLVAPTAASDLSSTSSPAAKPMSASQLRSSLLGAAAASQPASRLPTSSQAAKSSPGRTRR